MPRYHKEKRRRMDGGEGGRENPGSLKSQSTLEYSTRVVHDRDRRCKKSTLSTPDPSNEPAKTQSTHV